MAEAEDPGTLCLGCGRSSATEQLPQSSVGWQTYKIIQTYTNYNTKYRKMIWDYWHLQTMFKNIKNLRKTSFHSNVIAHWPNAQQETPDGWEGRLVIFTSLAALRGWDRWIGKMRKGIEKASQQISHGQRDDSTVTARTTHAYPAYTCHTYHTSRAQYGYDFMWRAQCAMWHRAFSTLLHLTTTVALCQANSAVKSSGKPPCDFLALLQISRCAKHTTWERPLKTKTSPDVSGLSHYVLWGSKML
jgi:hypothetical protein